MARRATISRPSPVLGRLALRCCARSGALTFVRTVTCDLAGSRRPPDTNPPTRPSPPPPRRILERLRLPRSADFMVPLALEPTGGSVQRPSSICCIGASVYKLDVRPHHPAGVNRGRKSSTDCRTDGSHWVLRYRLGLSRPPRTAPGPWLPSRTLRFHVGLCRIPCVGQKPPKPRLIHPCRRVEVPSDGLLNLACPCREVKLQLFNDLPDHAKSSTTRACARMGA